MIRWLLLVLVIALPGTSYAVSAKNLTEYIPQAVTVIGCGPKGEPEPIALAIVSRHDYTVGSVDKVFLESSGITQMMMYRHVSFYIVVDCKGQFVGVGVVE